MVDPRQMRPGEVVRLLNSTPLGTVLSDRALREHRQTAGLRIGDAGSVDLIRYAGWMAQRVHIQAAKKKETPSPASSAYEAHRERAAARSREQSEKSREIGAIPPVKDAKRKRRCKKNFRAFCEAYLGQTFRLAWSPDHLKAIGKIQKCVLHGGLMAWAMWRGAGKSSLCEAAAIWSVLYGHREFVMLIGPDDDHAKAMLESIKISLETNELLLADFPEAIFPIAQMDGIAQRARGQTHLGVRTRLVWHEAKIILPTIPGSAASGACIRVAGITASGIRGPRHKRADGTVTRPSLAIIDDPQTDESARSLSQCATRERIVSGAILGMAGPGRQIAAFLPCTVIRRGDLADRLLNRRLHPRWQGERMKLLPAMPAALDLWQQYAELRRESLAADRRGEEATEFYRARRKPMDAGAVAAWPELKQDDELSAIQHAMNLWADDPVSFAAERQNEPLAEHDDAEALTAEQIAERVNGLAAGRVPLAVEHLTLFIDVQGTALYWVVCGWQPDFTGYVLDYGCFPPPSVRYFQLRNLTRTIQDATNTTSLEGAIFNSLQYVCATIGRKDWPRDDGARMRIEKILIDANWGPSTDTVYKFCRETDFAGVASPSHGRYVGASSRMLTAAAKKAGERVGLNWRIPAAKGARHVRHVLFDANAWKSFIHARLRTTAGDRGALTLFGERPGDHRLFGEHLTAEYSVRTSTKDRTVDEWKIRPERPDNHWFDGVVGCAVGASILGCELREAATQPAAKKRISFAAMQKAAQAKRRGNG